LSIHSAKAAEIENSSSPSEVKKRIEGVINGLLLETGVKNKFAPPASLKSRMAFYHTPGVSVAVINNYQIEWAKGFGLTEAGKRAIVTEHTLFQAGSVSKPVFAMGVMKLVQDGKLDLDQDINQYLTTWKVPAVGSWQPKVTLRQILSHSAGFSVHGFRGYSTTSKIPTLKQILDGEPPANSPPIRVSSLPGTHFSYSGGGIEVGQQAVIDVLQKPFPDIMADLIFNPLHLKESTYEQPLPASRAKMAASGHPEDGQVLTGKEHIYPEMAAAGLWTTPSDLASIGIEMQMALKGDKNRLLSPTTAAEMVKPTKGPMGIGFMVEGDGDNARFKHNGYDEGFISEVIFYKNQGKGAVVMINSNEGGPITDEVIRAIAREYNWPGFFEDEHKKITLDPKALASLIGEYAAKPDMKFTIKEDDKRLFLVLNGQAPIELVPTSDTKFYIESLNSEVSFEKVSGKVKGLTLQQDGDSIVAERKN
jgi:CubicO group peptidase (beta-lactamase class C family)